MSIHILLGKPGSGKSLYATNRVLRELSETGRNIVTNLPLRMGALNEYVQKRWPDQNLRAVERIRLLSDDEMREFWKIRGEGDGAQGVAYFLDEAHIAFNAREWATLGKGALHYLSQHRKLGDIVWVITQAPGNLDKQFRSVAEDFTVLRNEYTAKWGAFRGRGRFVRKSYLSEPQSSSEPFETASFSLDGVAECYDTAKGIGVHGNKADIGRRAKGIPIMWVLPLGVLLCSLAFVVPWGMGKAAGWYLGSKAPENVPAKVDGAAVSVSAPSSGVNAFVPPPAVPVVRPVVAASGDAVWVVGYAVRGRRLNVQLSDGRTLTEADDLKRVERNFAEMHDGTRYYLRRPEAKPVEKVPASKTAEQLEAEKVSVAGYAGESLFEPSPGLDVVAVPAAVQNGGNRGQTARNAVRGGTVGAGFSRP